MPGTGAGLVVLKRVDEALRDGDNIYAVIKGFAVNNDGSEKISYTAPSVDAQARAIAQAQRLAGLTPQDITYVEAHGTGTRLGDPVEFSALSQAFAGASQKPSLCGRVTKAVLCAGVGNKSSTVRWGR